VAPHIIQSDTAYLSNTGALTGDHTWGHQSAADVVDRVRFTYTGGNIVSGSISLYGLRSSSRPTAR
jgi:hypothetical protein